MSVIQLEDVTRVYQVGEVETPALRGLTLTIEEGWKAKGTGVFF